MSDSASPAGGRAESGAGGSEQAPEGVAPSPWSPTPYGPFYRAAAAHPRYVPELAVIFVHGILSGPARWHALRDLAYAEAGVEADALFFRYPAYPFQSSTLGDAARRLRTAIDVQFPRRVHRPRASRAGDADGEPRPDHRREYRHFVFVTHSFGGLVVKRALVAEPSQGNDDEPLVTHCRAILNLAVPHARGAWWLCAGAVLYSALNVLLYPVLIALWAVTFGWLKAGWNGIYVQLYMTGLLKGLDQGLTSARDHADERRVPFPRVLEIVAEDDAAVGAWASDHREIIAKDESSWRIPGLHMGLGVPKTPADGTVVRLAKILAEVSHAEEYLVCERTFDFNRTRERRVGMTDLLHGVAGSLQQQEVYARIDGLALRPIGRRAQIVVTGSIGLGKSRLIGRYARDRAVDFLRAGDTDGTLLPVLIQLQDLKVPKPDAAPVQSEAATGTPLLDAIFAEWVRWANVHVARRPTLSVAWLRDRLEHGSTLLMLDSVDEFFVNNGWASAGQFHQELERFPVPPDGDGHSQMICLGIRKGFHGLAAFEGGTWRVLSLEPIDREWACQRYPGVRGLLDRLEEGRVRDDDETGSFFLSPIIFFLLAPHVERLAKLASVKQYEVLSEALDVVLSNSNLGDTTSTDARVMLRCIAWAFYANLSPVLDWEAIGEGLKGLQPIWEDQPNNALILKSLGALAASKDKHAVMNTVFEATGGDLWRFSHVAWRDLLIGDYIADCARSGNVDALGRISFGPREHQLAGQKIGDWPVSAEMIRRATELSNETGNMLALGNVLAVVGMNPRASLDKPALSAFEDSVRAPRTSPLNRCLVLNGLCTRYGAEGPKRTTLELLTELVEADAEQDGIDAINHSLAWSYAKKHGLPAADRVTPRPLDDTALPAAYSIYEDAEDSGLGIPRPNALQPSITRLSQKLWEDPEARGIASVHYLYFVYAAWRMGEVVNEVSAQLGALLVGGSEFEVALLATESVPDHVKQAFRGMQAAYEKGGG